MTYNPRGRTVSRMASEPNNLHRERSHTAVGPAGTSHTTTNPMPGHLTRSVSDGPPMPLAAVPSTQVPAGRYVYRVVVELANYWLRIEYPDLQLLDYAHGTVCKSWPLPFLRAYGQEGSLFTIEAGRRCSSGPGVFSFIIPEQHTNIATVIDDIINEQDARPPTTPQTPSSRRSSDQSAAPPEPQPQLMYVQVESLPYPMSPPGTSEPGDRDSRSGSPADPRMTVSPTSSTSYAVVDIVRTEALGRALAQSQHDTAGRHPSMRETVAIKPRSASEDRSLPRRDSKEREISSEAMMDDLNDLLDSLAVETGEQPERRASAPSGHHAYVNLHPYVNIDLPHEHPPPAGTTFTGLAAVAEDTC